MGTRWEEARCCSINVICWTTYKQQIKKWNVHCLMHPTHNSCIDEYLTSFKPTLSTKYDLTWTSDATLQLSKLDISSVSSHFFWIFGAKKLAPLFGQTNRSKTPRRHSVPMGDDLVTATSVDLLSGGATLPWKAVVLWNDGDHGRIMVITCHNSPQKSWDLGYLDISIGKRFLTWKNIY